MTQVYGSSMPMSRLKIYRDLFEEVIERDRVFGSLLRKIKNAYELAINQDSAAPTPQQQPHGAKASMSRPPQMEWSSSLGHSYAGGHSNEPTTRTEEGMQAWEMQRENRALKDLVERLHLELEDAVRRERRWKHKVGKLKAQADSGVYPPGHHDGAYPTSEEMRKEEFGDSYSKQAAASMMKARHWQEAESVLKGPGGYMPPSMAMDPRVGGGYHKFHANRREPGPPSSDVPDPMNQGGLLSISSVSPPLGAHDRERMPADGTAASETETARSTDSGMLPQRPDRRQVIRPAYVPALDFTRLDQALEEDEEEQDAAYAEGVAYGDGAYYGDAAAQYGDGRMDDQDGQVDPHHGYAVHPHHHQLWAMQQHHDGGQDGPYAHGYMQGGESDDEDGDMDAYHGHMPPGSQT